MGWIPLAAAAALALLTGTSRAGPTYVVTAVDAPDEKAVFATVESVDVVAARVRTGGTIASLAVKDIARAESLFKSGVSTRARLDEATTAANVAANMLKARSAERAVLEQQLAEGQVLAPTAGRVLKVPVTVGTVVMSGETVASIAQQDFVLRLRVPERHARFLRAGDPVRLDREGLPPGAADRGTVTLVYPQIQDGRVVADARVAGRGDYFVGERVRVWISGGQRRTFIVPSRYIVTRFGLDYARLRRLDGATVDVPVQRGRERPLADMTDGLEILSGLQPGDVLVQP